MKSLIPHDQKADIAKRLIHGESPSSISEKTGLSVNEVLSILGDGDFSGKLLELFKLQAKGIALIAHNNIARIAFDEKASAATQLKASKILVDIARELEEISPNDLEPSNMSQSQLADRLKELQKEAKHKAKNIRDAKNVIDTALNLFNAFGVIHPQSLIDLRNSIMTDDIAAILKADDDRIEAERIAAEKEAKLKEKKIRNFMEKWWIKNELPPENQGFTVFSPYSSSKIYMRINGENIETSKGATFPIAHAVKAFKLLRVLKEKEVTYTPLGNKTIHLGHFKIDKVDAQGNVTAGCHFVEWDQIERCATELKIYP